MPLPFNIVRAATATFRPSLGPLSEQASAFPEPARVKRQLPVQYNAGTIANLLEVFPEDTFSVPF